MAAPARTAATKAAPKAAAKKAPVVSKSTNRTASAIATHQIKSNTTTAAHQARSRESVKAHGEKQEQRVSASRQIATDKANLRREAEQEKQYAKASQQSRRAVDTQKIQRRSSLVGAAKVPFQPHDTVSINSSNPVINPILLILFTWAAIVVMYALITHPGPTSGFASSMRAWVKLLYQTEPVFTLAKPPIPKPVTPPAFGGGGSGSNGGGGAGGAF
jgi:hypothetical protein